MKLSKEARIAIAESIGFYSQTGLLNFWATRLGYQTINEDYNLRQV